MCMLVNDINSELHPLAIDVHCFDRSALFGAGITLYSEDGWMLLLVAIILAAAFFFLAVS